MHDSGTRADTALGLACLVKVLLLSRLVQLSPDKRRQMSGGAGEHDAVTDELQRLGFTEGDGERAVQGVGQASLAACLDWLCLHLLEEDLPPAFAPGGESLLLPVSELNALGTLTTMK